MRNSPESGFTLIELIVVFALMAIMLMIAVPNFSNFTSRYRLTATSNDFLSGVTLTRNEAIKRGRRVDMVPASGTNWTTGWVVFVDKNGNQAVDAGEEVIFRHPAMPGSVTISATTGGCAIASGATPFLAGVKSFIAYLGTGYPSNSTIPGGMILNDASNSRILCINFIGRPRVL